MGTYEKREVGSQVTPSMRSSEQESTLSVTTGCIPFLAQTASSDGNSLPLKPYLMSAGDEDPSPAVSTQRFFSASAPGNPPEKPADSSTSRENSERQTPEKPLLKRREGGSEASVASQPTGPADIFLRPGGDKNVVYPYRPEIEATPLICGKEFFGALAESIVKAKKSIDLVSWGIDTDMVCNRTGDKDSANQRSLEGSPHDILCPFNYEICAANAGICPHKDKAITNTTSLRLADLLSCVAIRGVNVRLLIWEPVYFANNVIDPCHYWFKCKMGIVPNTQFAFRKFEGTYYESKPSFPEIKIPKQGFFTTYEEEYRKGETRKREEIIRKKLIQYPKLYSFTYSHHQKMALFDVDAAHGFNPELAHGFIMGLNMKEEYWDDTQHAEVSATRIPTTAMGNANMNFRPWQDVGVKLRGPILRDLAENMQQGWNQKEEIIPVSFIGSGLTALNGHEKLRNAKWNQDEFAAVTGGMDTAMPPSPRFWKLNLELWGLGVCAFFTGLVNLIDGVLAGKFDIADTVKSEKIWPGSPPEADRFLLSPGIKEGVYRQPGQYMRTFYLNGDPKDLSIQQGIYRAIQAVQGGGLLYFENQYFRDPYLGAHLVDLRGTGKDNKVARPSPYIIVVTNRQTNDDGNAVNAEAIFAADPTYMVYQQLTKLYGADKILFCWMRTKNPHPPTYESPRASHTGGALVDAIVQHYKGGGLNDLLGLKQRLLFLRNGLYKALPYGPGGWTSSALFTLQDWNDLMGLKLDRMFGWIIPDFSDLKQMAISALIEGADTITELTDLYGMLDSTITVLEDTVSEAEKWKSPGGTLPDTLFSSVSEDEIAKNRRISNEIMMRYAKERKTFEHYWQTRQHNYRQQILQDRAEIQRITEEIKRLEAQKVYVSGLASWRIGWRIDSKKNDIEDLHNDIKIKEEMMSYESSKSVPGMIYVHSKVLIVDEAATMIGSNNINERSMWHDSENAVLIRATEKNNFPRELRKRLFNIMLDGDNSRDTSPEDLFDRFKTHANTNFENDQTKKWLKSHIITYTPHEKFGGSSVLS